MPHAASSPRGSDGTVRCNHSWPARRLVSTARQNPGRAFYRCSESNKQLQCGFWVWEDEIPPLQGQPQSSPTVIGLDRATQATLAVSSSEACSTPTSLRTVPQAPITPVTPAHLAQASSRITDQAAHQKRLQAIQQGLLTIERQASDQDASLPATSSPSLLEEKPEADNPGWSSDPSMSEDELWAKLASPTRALIVTLPRTPVSLRKPTRGKSMDVDADAEDDGSSLVLPHKQRRMSSYAAVDLEDSDGSTFDGNDSPLAGRDVMWGAARPRTSKYKLPVRPKLVPRTSSGSLTGESRDSFLGEIASELQTQSAQLKMMEEYVRELETRLAVNEENMAIKDAEIVTLRRRIDELAVA